MLKTEDLIRQFTYGKGTDRDSELVLFLEFLRSHPVESFLDIGAHYSTYNEYADKVRPQVKRYDGVDIIPDPEATKILDNFYVGNANDIKLQQYDMVVCISTIEHAGVSTYKAEDIKKEQNRLFETCLNHAKKYMWISFPVGQQYVYPNELSVITEDQLSYWEKLTKPYKVNQFYLYTQGAQAGHPWNQHRKRETAVKIPYIDFIGNQSICVMEVEK